jgi:uracil DNA glycosylase
MENDPLRLKELFDGGGEPWLPLLGPTLAQRPNAADFIGPDRPKTVVPVRELTFQALKPRPPAGWNVVVFGQNPYPRVESATGIAMFDNAFGAWSDPRFGKVTSIRCIVKAACMWKHGIEKSTSTDTIRRLLTKEKTLAPPAWFGAMLAQGVLLLNASLTASTDDALTTSQHTAFWRPVIERVIASILEAKKSAPPGQRGVVFAWWGNHAKALRKVVDEIHARVPEVAVRHIEHPNPAAMGDAFCNGNHFGDVNDALRELGLPEVDWLPSEGFSAGAESHRMGAFIDHTMELHKQYLERLQGVGDETAISLAPITGILAMPRPSFAAVLQMLAPVDKGMAFWGNKARELAEKKLVAALDVEERAAVLLYTLETALYKKLNAALRSPDRTAADLYRGYLRLLLGALSKLPVSSAVLYRGVAKDLRSEYPRGSTITWWGVSSCTSKLAVARGFLGASGRRTLFEVHTKTAVSIRELSAFSGEEELVLAPGTALSVREVRPEASGLTTVVLEESTELRRVG